MILKSVINWLSGRCFLFLELLWQLESTWGWCRCCRDSSACAGSRSPHSPGSCRTDSPLWPCRLFCSPAGCPPPSGSPWRGLCSVRGLAGSCRCRSWWGCWSRDLPAGRGEIVPTWLWSSRLVWPAHSLSLDWAHSQDFLYLRFVDCGRLAYSALYSVLFLVLNQTRNQLKQVQNAL